MGLDQTQRLLMIPKIERALGLPVSSIVTLRYTGNHERYVLLSKYAKQYREKYLAEHPEIIEEAERSVPEIAATAPVLNTEFTKEFEGMNPAQLRASAIRYKKLNGLSEDYSEFNGKNPAQLRALAINYKEAYQDVLSWAIEGRPIVAEGAERPFSSFERNPRHARLEGVSGVARKTLLNEQLHERDRLLGLPEQMEQHPEAQGLQPVPMHRIVNAALHYNDYLRSLSPEAMGRLQHQELEKIRIKHEQELERVRLKQERALDERNRLEAAVAEMNSLPRVGMNHDVMKTARSTKEEKDFTNRALRERDRFLGLPAQGGFDHPELRVTKNPQEARNLGNQALRYLDHLKKTSLKKQALPISFTNEALGRIRLANGNFRLVSSVNKANGVVEVEKASVWKEGGTNNGLFDLKLSGEYDLFPGQGQIFGTVFSDSPVVMHAEAGTNVSNTLKFSPIQAPLLTIKKVGDWAITEDVDVVSPLRLDLTGDLLPSAKLRSPFIEILRARNFRTSAGSGTNVGMLISGEGPLVLHVEEQIETPVGYLFGKAGMNVRARNIVHGSRYEKAPTATGLKYLANDSKWQTDVGDIDIQAEEMTNAHGKISADKGRLLMNGRTITNTAGSIYALLGGQITANKLVVKREDYLSVTGASYCPGHTEDGPYGRIYYTHQGPCIKGATTITEQSNEGILQVDGDLDVNVDTVEVDGSQITALGRIRFKGGQWRDDFNSTKESVQALKDSGLTVAPPRGKATAIIRAGKSVEAELERLTISGRIEASGIFLSAANYVMKSLGITDGAGRAMQLINVSDALREAAAAGRPWLSLTGTSSHPVVEHVAPLTLGYNTPTISVFGAREAMPKMVHFIADLPIVQDFARDLVMGLSHRTMNMGDATLRTLSRNALRFAEQREKAITEGASTTTSGTMMKFGMANVTREDLENATTAMLFGEINNGVSQAISRAEADIEAASRIAVSSASAELTEVPTIDYKLLIPAQKAEEKASGLFTGVGDDDEDGDIELEAKNIEAERGRRIERTGDAMKGCEYEVFTGSLSMHARKGKVKVRGAGFMRNVDTQARDGVDIDANVDQKATPLAHREWDYRPKPVEKTYRNLPFTRPGYLPEGFGLQGQRFYEMAGFNLSAGRGGSSSQGFGMFGGRRNDPLEISGGYRVAAPYLGVMNNSNMRAHVMIGGLSDRIEEQVHEMQQEHARIEQEKRYEEELARITLNHRPVQKMAALDDADEETSTSKKKASASAKSGFLDAIWESVEDGKDDEGEDLASAFGRLGGREQESNASLQERGRSRFVEESLRDARRRKGRDLSPPSRNMVIESASEFYLRSYSASNALEVMSDPKNLLHAASYIPGATGVAVAAVQGVHDIETGAKNAHEVMLDLALASTGALGKGMRTLGASTKALKKAEKVWDVEGAPQKAQYRINDANAEVQGIKGIDKPFRNPNVAHAPDAVIVKKMNGLAIEPGTDCSDIASSLHREAGKGRILQVTGKEGSRLKLFENGAVSEPEFVYHQVFTDGKYVYDPRLSNTAVPLGDWKSMIQSLNPGALIK